MTHWWRLFLGFLLCVPLLLSAQIFSWKNPNFPNDSIPADSIISAKMEKDFFTRDTLDFIRLKNKILIDEAVLVKNDRKKILGDLNAKGSFVRGISFGNNQGSSVQSAMDMQITGKLSQDVSVIASISDHNLPIQADGYTQSLEEFDRIFVQLNIKKKNILRAGHLDLVDDKSYFTKFQRRSLGLQFQTEMGEENKTLLNISAGIARSEFHRIRFQGIEGNQGPYRLTGKNGENFITIISGSEQVFIDGILMKRGENLDYTINYNTGEITFTSFRPIFRQNFITISYNYTNRNYNRYLFTADIEHRRNQFQSGIKWFYETDNKSAPLALHLSPEDKKTLAQAGNNTELMYSDSAEITEYDVNKILYKRVFIGNDFYYEHSNDDSETLYQVAFTHFGEGKGDYNLAQTLSNGRVFVFVGANAGAYRAVRKLPAPQSTQILAYHAQYHWNKGKIGTDIVYSAYDANLFSSKDAEQNSGYATRVFGNHQWEKHRWKATTAFEYQRISSRFRILDRINSVEFARDFNLAQEFNQKTQNRLIFHFMNTWNTQSFANYQLNFLHEDGGYKGLKNDIDFRWKKEKSQTTGKISFLNTQSEIEKTEFLRAHITQHFHTRWGHSSVGASMEKNMRKYTHNNTFDSSSFGWKELFVQHKIGDSVRTKLLAKAYFRDNDSIRENQLINLHKIIGTQIESRLIRNKNTTLNALLHYRKFFAQHETQVVPQQDYLIGNILYHQQLWKGGMRLQAFYELGNGQEAQREFQYLRVADGKGIYKWTDYNGDGIQQLDEFEIAEYADLAQYIRIYTNAIQYLPSNKNKTQFSLFLNPATLFNSENKFLKRFQLNLSLNSQNAYLKNNRFWVLNPFEKNKDQILKNQTLLAALQFHTNEISGWNGVYRFTDNNHILNANFSQEARASKTHLLTIGYWFHKDLRIDWENTATQITNASEVLSNRNFLLHNIETQPKLTYKFSTAFQSELSGSWKYRNRKDGEERLRTLDITGTLQWESKKASLRASFSWIKNDFTGNSFSLVGNQMLDGLKTGVNKVWTVFFQHPINSFIMLNMNYEGRNSGEKTIHIGSMQLKASF